MLLFHLLSVQLFIVCIFLNQTTFSFVNVNATAFTSFLLQRRCASMRLAIGINNWLQEQLTVSASHHKTELRITLSGCMQQASCAQATCCNAKRLCTVLNSKTSNNWWSSITVNHQIYRMNFSISFVSLQCPVLNSSLIVHGKVEILSRYRPIASYSATCCTNVYCFFFLDNDS
jgi:hypothetical protein